MTRVAVVAHSGKSVGGGLQELRRSLADEGVDDPDWYEVDKSRKAPPCLRKALKRGAGLVLVWGGDGMVQRGVQVLAGSSAALVVVPAGTANLLARNLGIPIDLREAVRVALHGDRRRLDLGDLNGDPFAVMAGAGFDASMIAAADGTLKDRLGRLAYVWTGARNLTEPPFRVRVRVDGKRWYEGVASCILVGNVGRLFGGVEVFAQAEPDDGILEVGLVAADGPLDWARTLARTVADTPEGSPFVHVTRARELDVRAERKVRYELDGGFRGKSRKLRVSIRPAAVEVCVPRAGPAP